LFLDALFDLPAPRWWAGLELVFGRRILDLVLFALFVCDLLLGCSSNAATSGGVDLWLLGLRTLGERIVGLDQVVVLDVGASVISSRALWALLLRAGSRSVAAALRGSSALCVVVVEILGVRRVGIEVKLPLRAARHERRCGEVKLARATLGRNGE
jgi:hypothetical protein